MFHFFTSASSFRRNRWIGSPQLNRLGLHIWRKKFAHVMTTLRRPLLGWPLPADERQRFARDGFVELPDFLTAAHLAAIKAEITSTDWPMLEMTQPPANTQRVNLDTQLLGQNYPALRQLIKLPALTDWLGYAAGYPGTPIISLQIIRSQGVAAGTDPQTDWHRDTFHSVAKAWLFLHDVPADQGPFAYVPGSHRPTPEHWDWEYQQSLTAHAEANPMHANGSFRMEEQDLAALGYGEPHTAVVAGNTLVVADTGGLHRRTPSPGPTVRLEIYLTLRRNPFFAGVFPSVLSWPIVRSHWAGWTYRYSQWLLARGTPGWIPIGRHGLKPDEVALLGGAPVIEAPPAAARETAVQVQAASEAEVQTAEALSEQELLKPL